jgi:peptidoglycan/xylan/chitin deacetylase (PgdA/CDA1 family)
VCLNHTPIPVLITWDVDPERWATAEHRQNALTLALDLCEEFGVRSTFFITANFAHEYPTQIDRMLALGQEIGCHGLTHTDEEDYNRMPVEMQRTYIEDATQKLEAVVGSSIRSFRSPRVKTSGYTLKLLGEYGYLGDSSVCSQRVDFVSSNLINPGWLVAPRLPYHPTAASAFRRGNLPIWEVPITAMGIPFISSALKVFGRRFIINFFRLIYAESRSTGKPIVYLAHPTEFLDLRDLRTRLTLKDFYPNRIRTHGLLARTLFYRVGGKALFEATRELFGAVASLPDITFLTCNEYVCQLNRTAKSNLP